MTNVPILQDACTVTESLILTRGYNFVIFRRDSKQITFPKHAVT